MEHDSGRTAMWICGALLGLLRSKEMVTDHEINVLANSLARGAAGEPADVRADMERAADWLRHSVPAAND